MLGKRGGEILFSVNNSLSIMSMAKAKTQATAPEAAVAVHDEAWAAYQAESEAKSGNRRPTPPGLRLSGKTGVWSRSHYNSDTKETVFTELEAKKFDAVFLAVKFYSKLKYDADAVVSVQTKEFSDFRSERIELVRRDLAAGAQPTSTFYDSYADFKEAVTTVDKVTNKSKSPFDLWVSIYALVDGEVIRYRGKGDSRSAYFDYTKEVKSPKTVVTELGVSDLITERDGKAVAAPYYHATFTAKGEVPAELRGKVIEAARDLDTWFASFTQEQVKPAPAALIEGASEEPPIESYDF